MRKKLKDYPTLINSLHHGLTFATDSEINTFILTKYRLYSYLWEDDADNTAALETIIKEWNDYTNQLHITTQYEYDPIENYNRTETGTDTRTDNLAHSENVTQTPENWKTTQTQTPDEWKESEQQTPLNWKSETSEGGYNTSDSVPTSNTVQSGTYTTDKTQSGTFTTESEQSGTFNTATSGSDTGTQTNTHSLNVHGNIGTMSTQQMIVQQRDIIIDVLDFYVAKFADAFQILM